MPQQKERWTSLEEPALRSQIGDLESEWIIKGHRREYESAERTYEQFLGNSPSVVWNEWAMHCMSGVDQLTDATTAQEFFPCGYAPSNVLDSSAWTALTLTANEVVGLAQAAPSEIRTLLGNDQIDLDIDSLSLEISSAVITRSWFAHEVFRSRFWKFYGSHRLISNGQLPPSGECPAYVVAVVFARNLIIKLKPHSTKNQHAMTILKTAPTRTFATFRFAASPVSPSSGQAVMLKSAVQSPPSLMTKRSVEIPRPVGTTRLARPVRSTQFTRVVEAEPNRLPASAATQQRIALQRMQGKSFRILRAEAITLPPPQPLPPPAPEVQIPFDKDEVWILGVVCRRLPLCPNPDPALQWD